MKHQSADPDSRWTAIIPVKALTRAKTRLVLTIPSVPHQQLAHALASDTVLAAVDCSRIRRVLVVTDDETVAAAMSGIGATIVPESSEIAATAPGFARLNAAFDTGARYARNTFGMTGVIALTGDLPALRSAELAEVIDAAAAYERSFLADAHGTGTAALTAAPDAELRPEFGNASAAAHEAGGAVALRLPAASVRQDVDTLEDLRRAATLGLGPHTSRLLAGLPGF